MIPVLYVSLFFPIVSIFYSFCFFKIYFQPDIDLCRLDPSKRQIIIFRVYLLYSLNNSCSVNIVFFDFSKAFDTDPHKLFDSQIFVPWYL